MGVDKKINGRLGMILVSLVLILSIFAMILLNQSTAWFADSTSAGAEGFHV